jgi:CubicO group peptidase (beta-lactamase class C family)
MVMVWSECLSWSWWWYLSGRSPAWYGHGGQAGQRGFSVPVAELADGTNTRHQMFFYELRSNYTSTTFCSSHPLVQAEAIKV